MTLVQFSVNTTTEIWESYLRCELYDDFCRDSLARSGDHNHESQRESWFRIIHYAQERPIVEIEKDLAKAEAVALLQEITKALESDTAKTINVADLTIELPNEMDFSLEYEVDDGETELELEFSWSTSKRSHKAKFEVFKGADRQWYFHLKAPDGKVILASEAYHNKQGALNGIESVRNNAQPEQFEIRESKAGQPYFDLHAKNRRIIGTSQMYKRRTGCDRDIKSVIKYAPEAEESLVEA